MILETNLSPSLSSLSRAAVLIALSGVIGCGFSERSFPLSAVETPKISRASSSAPVSTREWLARAHQRLEHLLPASDVPALITEGLTDAEGRAVDVRAHFGNKRKNLRTLAGNWRGLRHTAQAVGSESGIDHSPPPWPGFDDVQIPISESLSLSGRLGIAMREGRPRSADCIVILPGLFGDNSVLRTRDLAAALRAHGFHVLALELRAHGRTEALHPEVYSTFGVMETTDLLLVSEWLEKLPYVRRTGLIGFCWGANISLLAAWYDGMHGQHTSITAAIAEHLPSVSSRPHFRAGIIAFSSVLRFEELLEELETPRSALKDPVLANMQDTNRSRARRKHHPEVTHSLRKLIEFEFARSELSYTGSVRDGVRFLRFLPFHGEPAGDKLADARVPVLIVHGANDPLCPAQDVADLMAGLSNPNVAAIILAGGGHVGFAPYARSYYFNLILEFFNR